MKIKLNLPDFKKNKNTWIKTNNFLSYLINIQYSKNSYNNLTNFTLNIGVYCPEIQLILWGNKLKNIDEVDCIFRERISYFLETKKDIWWNVTSEENLILVEKEINVIVEKKVIPFFNSINNYTELEIIIKKWENNQKNHQLFKIQYSILKYLLNEKNESFKLLNEIKNDKTWGEKINKVMNEIF